MIVIPSIDLLGGKVVRLKRGNFKEVTVYGDDPAEIARRWESQGAGLIHVVDLDGALHGEPKNMKSVEAITSAVKVRIELGGGLRTMDDIERAFDAGAARVVLGTKLADDMKFIAEAVRKFGGSVIAGIDVRDGFVATKGWTEKTKKTAAGLAGDVKELGISEVIYTDISSDGMLSGPNIDKLKGFVKDADISVILSGGISAIADIQKLIGAKIGNLSGAIVGRAIYEGRISLREAVELCSRSV